jgi:hypothetical protein
MRLLLAAVDVVTWPFEQAGWAVERWIVWPLRESLAGWRPSGRWAGGAALATIGAAAILVGVMALSGGGEAASERSGEQARVAIVPPGEPKAQSPEPEPTTLHGAPLRFGAGGVAAPADSGATGAESSPASGVSAASGAGSNGVAAGASGEGAAPVEQPAAAASTAGKPVPAGPAAMKVAGRFARAFVFYEIGGRPARVKAVFGETATEQLANALEERPPRLPSGGRVPKAKVLNLVPGPRFGGQYTVSVSLLRVGATSELRITLKKERGGEWRVASILG